MIKLDGMLMIGSAGANAGKTELACALIRKFSNSRDIVGIKVTTIKTKDGQCPRGGQGCGVCSSLDGNFTITEETESNSKKDTARLLAAGASRVFWLRVMKSHLQEGLTALLNIIGPVSVSVCESNSLRQAVEPGLFLMVKGLNLKVWKSSAQEVRKYADRIVVSDGNGFDFDPVRSKTPEGTSNGVDLGRIKLTPDLIGGGKWTMLEKATAIIMAGGNSSRMGVDKSMLLIKDKPIIETISQQLRGTFSQILISANEAKKLAYLGFEIIPDKMPGQGPLMGISSALEASANELNFVAACDIPHIDLAFVRRMLTEAKEVDIVIPITEKREVSKTEKRNTQYAIRNTRYEPLFAVYCKSALEAINEVLSSGGRRISDVFAPLEIPGAKRKQKAKNSLTGFGRCRVKYIELEAERFMNLNTMAEYEESQKKYND